MTVTRWAETEMVEVSGAGLTYDAATGCGHLGREQGARCCGQLVLQKYHPHLALQQSRHVVEFLRYGVVDDLYLNSEVPC